MPTITYDFEGEQKEIEVTDGDTNKPVVVLLHGTGGTILDMTDPANGPDNNYNHSGSFPGDVTIGWRAYPGVGVWSCCDLDPKMEVTSWREILVQYKYRTAVYSQEDRSGPLARPVRELAVVMEHLYAHFPKARFVLLAQSRGGLLVRKFLKDNPELAASRVVKVITLHSPHEGSALASIASALHDAIDTLENTFGAIVTDALGWLLDIVDSPAYQEMQVGGPFLSDLADGEQPLPGVEYYTFGGISVRLTRIRSWVYTLDSAVPQWHWPPFEHRRTMIEVPVISPVADSVPNLVPELSDGAGDLLTADERTRLPFAVHQTNRINHAETLWDETLQLQVLRILGEDVSFWN